MSEAEIKKIIYQELKRIAPETEPEKLLPGDNIRQTLDIDSFDYLQFIIALDKKLCIQTPEEDYGKVTNINDLVTYIISKNKSV